MSVFSKKDPNEKSETDDNREDDNQETTQAVNAPDSVSEDDSNQSIGEPDEQTLDEDSSEDSQDSDNDQDGDIDIDDNDIDESETQTKPEDAGIQNIEPLARVKKETFSLPSAPAKGTCFAAVADQDRSIQIKIKDGVYILDKEDYTEIEYFEQVKDDEGQLKQVKRTYNLDKNEFIHLLSQAGFKPIYDIIKRKRLKTVEVDGEEVKVEVEPKRIYKLLHSDFVLNSANYSGPFSVFVDGKKRSVIIKNGLFLTEEENLKDALVKAGFDLLS